MKICLKDFLSICVSYPEDITFLGQISSYYEIFTYTELLIDYDISTLFIWRIEIDEFGKLLLYLTDSETS